ncbi:Stress response protein YsnF [Caballeronia terrestris]|uniref:Stress response protein YsnF n=1 Tax=Caballeronia terrestris TaxID=1226301 RepID=A0A158K8G9_9BURK|nr:YsnF/AvaK domain-containing protein [Caballeronia terrestris]SAL77416.1 Stress response protein YsnF [Caballeronia terrestris]
MAQTLVAVFNSYDDAQAAAGRLEADGIARSDLNIHARDDVRADLPAQGFAGTTDNGTPRDVTVGRSPGETEGGAMARIEHFFKNLFGDEDGPEDAGHYREAVRRGGAVLAVDVADESRVDAIRSVLSGAGAIDIDQRVTQWKSAGYAGYDAAAPVYSADEIAAERQRFNVVKEELEVGKREVQTGGVRVYSRVTETPVSESVNLREEHATIERRAVDRPATAADLKEGFVEIKETAEQPVVAKTARVVEEVVVGKEASERTETIQDTVRGTEVEVERVEGREGLVENDTLGKKPV